MSAQPNTTGIIVSWVVTLFTGGYMLPWAIAVTRGKSNAGAIGVWNLLTGWTIIGLIICLIWSLS